ncbi:MAG: HAD family hydrolase [Dehalococcoidia bacterium]|nr:HAD family hydrolase [Dehalococcoidia bacterium]
MAHRGDLSYYLPTDGGTALGTAPTNTGTYSAGTGRPDLIVFDWDQTLWNSWNFHVKTIGRTAASLGVEPPSEEQVAASFIVPFVKHVGNLFPHNPDEAMELYIGLYIAHIKDSGVLFPGVADTLTALKDAGYLLALFSDKRQKYGRMELEISGVGSLFDHVRFLDSRRPYKPNPMGLLQVLDALAMEPHNAMYVGDSPVDIQCAKRCGMAGAAALWGSLNRDALIHEGPTHICQGISDLLDVLGALGPA